MKATPLDYGLLATFLQVADAASFSKAAVALGVGKGTVSRAIARLEAQLGVELIHRTTHRVALSTAGLALYERTAPHLVALGHAVGRLPERGEEPSGELRLSAPHDFGVNLLPEVLAEFAVRYPEVTFDVRLTNARVDLVAEGFDLAIRVAGEREKDSTLTARRLGGVASGYYASPAYVARRGEPRAFGESSHEWVVFPTVLGKRAPRGFRPRFRTDDFFLLRDLLRQGAGVGSLPTFLAAPYVARGELVAVLPREHRRGGGGYFIVYPSSGQVSRKVSAFRDFLVERVRARPLDAS
jgi:DNA-binding transcriptional LysR family regulator